MSEARNRRTLHFKSDIFEEGPAERRAQSANSKRFEPSLIFVPLESSFKPLSYSREKYHQKTDIFFKNCEKTSDFVETPAKTLVYKENLNKHISRPAGKKEKTVPIGNILGNDPNSYYPKSSKIFKNFEPKYPETTPLQRKEKEFFGEFRSRDQRIQKIAEKIEKSAKERKKNNLRSVFDTNEFKENVFSVNNQRVQYDPLVRKHEILASAVFEDKKLQAYPKFVIKEEENEEKRKKNHLFTDLSGTIHENPHKPEENQEKLLSLSQCWIYHTNKTNNTA